MARNSGKDRFELSPSAAAKFRAFARVMARQSARESIYGLSTSSTSTESWVLGTCTATG
jgi:hypothetical protein